MPTTSNYGPFDSRENRNYFLELDVLNTTWSNLVIEHREAASDQERKRIKYEMAVAEHSYRSLFARLEEIVADYRPKEKKR